MKIIVLFFGVVIALSLAGCAGQIKHQTDLMNEFDQNLGKTRIDVSNLNSDVKADVVIGDIDKGFSPLKHLQAKKTAWLEPGFHDVEIITTIYTARPTLSNPGSSYDLTCHASSNLKANIAYTVRADAGIGCSFVESYTFEDGKRFYRNRIEELKESQGKQ